MRARNAATAAPALIALSLSSTRASAATITLNFDSVALGPDACANGAAYIASFGVTFVTVTGGAMPAICDTVGTPVTASSPDNVFYGLPAVSNTDESYDLLFSTPLTRLDFTRATVAPNTSLPAWNAFAYDATNTLLDSIMQPSIFPGPPAANFTLVGPGITRLRVEAFNSAAQTYNHPPFDDLVLSTVDATAPEPSTIALLVLGLGGMAIRRRAQRNSYR